MPKTAAILVGGQARRLGGLDKSRLTVGRRSVLDRQLDAIRPVADRIVLVGVTAPPPTHPELDCVPDRRPGCGSLGGIYTALCEQAGPVLVVACDMPFLSAAFLDALFDRLGHADAVIPRTADGWHPLCAVYAPACLDRFGQRLDAGRLKITEALDGLRVLSFGPDDLAPFDDDGALLMNLNTPDDVARAVARAGTAEA